MLYVVARDDYGKAYLLGPYDYSKAIKKAEASGGEVEEFPTSSNAEATRMFKEGLVGKVSFNTAVKRVGHKEEELIHENI